MMSQAVLFIIFNRPGVTETAFERIRQARPPRLYVAADGPRADRSGEADLCARTRAVTEKIDWDCKVERLYRDRNLGCGRAVSGALDWFFAREEQGIIIEDDIVPDLSFFSYCDELLRHHKDHADVMVINGCNFQQGVWRGEGSYYYSAFPHVWGWASWRRVWKLYDFNLSDLNYFYNLKKLRHYFNDKKIINTWHEIFFRMNRKMVDTWDYQLNYAVWNNKGKVITPNVNLISNIGFGAGATHTTDAASKFAGMPVQSLEEIIHPRFRQIDHDADLQSFIYCN